MAYPSPLLGKTEGVRTALEAVEVLSAVGSRADETCQTVPTPTRTHTCTS